MSHLLLVALGGGIGAGLRHLSATVALRIMGPNFPWGTFFVNVVGSLIMGLFIGWLVKRTGGSSQEIRLFFATGVLGGFTTFSAFSIDAANLLERGASIMALSYVLGSVLLSISAVFVGLMVARSVL
ncbi:MAG: fluoride efflux transporter CrcB [Hyphomicrobiales bacterium]|nr:MAG: fluoride efflux transporter CrcB [Hyphomicrobiales bacterium]